MWPKKERLQTPIFVGGNTSLSLLSDYANMDFDYVFATGTALFRLLATVLH